MVHSMVEFTDGSTIAQASPPDMRLPISLGLSWPDRVPGVGVPIDWSRAQSWTFEPLDEVAFPAVALAKRVGMAGATYPAVFNAANEQAVMAFHAGRIGYLEIVDTIDRVVDAHEPGDLTLEEFSRPRVGTDDRGCHPDGGTTSRRRLELGRNGGTRRRSRVDAPRLGVSLRVRRGGSVARIRGRGRRRASDRLVERRGRTDRHVARHAEHRHRDGSGLSHAVTGDRHVGDREDFEAIGRVTTPTRVEEYDWWGCEVAEAMVSQAGRPRMCWRAFNSDRSKRSRWRLRTPPDCRPGSTTTGSRSPPRSATCSRATSSAAGISSHCGSRETRHFEGGLDPLRFTFESDTLVYPLSFSRAATSPQTVRLFVFDDHRQRVTFVGGGEPAAAFTSWAAPVTGDRGRRRSATTSRCFSSDFSDPGAQILGDLEFAPTLTDETTGTEYTVTVPVALGPVPVGWLIVGFAFLGAIGALLVVAAVGAKRS